VDFVRILKEAGWSDEWAGGVVHSFTGTKEEMEELVSLLHGLRHTEIVLFAMLVEAGLLRAVCLGLMVDRNGALYRNKWVFNEDGGEPRSRTTYPSRQVAFGNR
jgi:hypothetical protein